MQYKRTKLLYALEILHSTFSLLNALLKKTLKLSTGGAECVCIGSTQAVPLGVCWLACGVRTGGIYMTSDETLKTSTKPQNATVEDKSMVTTLLEKTHTSPVVILPVLTSLSNYWVTTGSLLGDCFCSR